MYIGTYAIMWGLSMLNSKRIQVSGATSGLGRHTALTMASLGANVVICGRSSDRATLLKTEIGSMSEVALFDLTASLKLDNTRIFRIEGGVYAG